MLVLCLVPSLVAARAPRGVVVGAGVSVGVPVGRTDNEVFADDVSRYAASVLPLELWGAYRFNRFLSFGLSASWAPALEIIGCGPALCSAYLVRLAPMVGGHWRLDPIDAEAFGAVGPGFGWLSHSRGDVLTRWSGPLFANAQLGVNITAGRLVHVVPLITASVMQFRTLDVEGGGRSVSRAVHDPAVHYWISAGVRFEFQVTGRKPPPGPIVPSDAGEHYDRAVALAAGMDVLAKTGATAALHRRAEEVLEAVQRTRAALAGFHPQMRIHTDTEGLMTAADVLHELAELELTARGYLQADDASPR